MSAASAIRREPVALVTFIGASVVLALPVLKDFHVLTASQADVINVAIPGWIAALGMYARSLVTPNSSVAVTTDQAALLTAAATSTATSTLTPPVSAPVLPTYAVNPTNP